MFSTSTSLAAYPDTRANRPPQRPRLALRCPSAAPPRSGLSGVTTLDALNAQGLYKPQGEGCYYYDALTFAQPTVQALADQLGIRWLEDRLAQARHEQQVHDRLREYARDSGQGRRCRQAAVLISGAVGAGLVGGLNFGVFALLVAQVHAAMNQSPAGIGQAVAGRFSASAAGRQVGLNLLGALPGAAGYAVASGISAALLRPLIDAVALLLSGGGLTPLVPVDPAWVYPIPDPLNRHGHPVEGAAYAAALESNARLRQALARRQARMTDVADRFNLKFGTPLFAVCHAVRVMYQAALLVSQRQALAATTAGGLSAMASACAGFGLHLCAGAQRTVARVDVAPGVRLPLFVPRADLPWLRGECRPSLTLQVRQGFAAACRAEVRNVGLLRRVALGLPANGLAVYGGTVFINLLIPLGTLLAEQVRASPAGAIAVAGAVALVAFMLSYWSVCKALRLALQAVRLDSHRLAERQIALAFARSVERFSELWPRWVPVPYTALREPGAVPEAGPAVASFDAMNQVVIEGLELAERQGDHGHLEPGADLRLAEAYRRAAENARPAWAAQPQADRTSRY